MKILTDKAVNLINEYIDIFHETYSIKDAEKLALVIDTVIEVAEEKE